MNNYKYYFIYAAILVVVFSLGRFSAPASTQTKSDEHTVQHSDVNKDKNQDVKEVKKETHLPDGTVIIETSKEKQTSTHVETKNDSEASKSISTKTELRPSYRLGVLYQPPIGDFQKDSYAGIIERRLFSEIYAGLVIGKTVGLTLTIGF